MSFDELLKQPLPAVRDDGFSARVALHLARERQLRQNLAWAAVMTIVVALAWLSPLAQVSAMAADWLATMATTSQIFAYPVGALVLLWTWQSRPFRL